MISLSKKAKKETTYLPAAKGGGRVSIRDRLLVKGIFKLEKYIANTLYINEHILICYN